MDRLQIINKFIQERGYKSYCNIGIFTGFTLDGVQCEEKIGVDPEIHHYAGKESVFAGTSDAFFEQLPKNKKFDCFFVDGYHSDSQVYRDIKNALKHLNEGGVVLVHDCLPEAEEQTLGGDKFGNWCGNVYKGVIEAKMHMDIDFYTISTDWGVGVIHKTNTGKRLRGKLQGPTWETFSKNKETLLNLISVEEFLKKFENSSTTTLSYTAKSHWEQYDKEHGTNKVEEIYGHIAIPMVQLPPEDFLDKIQPLYVAGIDPYKREGDSLGEVQVFKTPTQHSTGELKPREDGE